MQKRLPIGIENFREICTEAYYYIDKTGLIRELMNDGGKISLFTRPRRFGKSLNMSMFKTFFELGQDKHVFDGLEISKEKDICEKYQGKFPVISITLKSVQGLTYESAKGMMKNLVRREAMRFQFLGQSDALTEKEKRRYEELLQSEISEDTLSDSLLLLSDLLRKHYDENVVLLIDEYDVPLDKAYQAGYYEEMVSLIRNFMGNALKTNDNLQFAILTGCLRISKESIFTGLNNFKVLSITDVRFDEYFGFTDSEVKELLNYYGLDSHFETIKQWYNGYRFGDTLVYCPWDVINYCDLLRADPTAEPEDYWINTSGNAIIRQLIEKADKRTQKELECLVAGETIVKEVRQELTYGELDSTIENIWSVMFSTGYLTYREKVGWKKYRLAIPNHEIRQIFVEQILDWFQKAARKDTTKLDAFCTAFPAQDTEAIEALFNEYLRKTISIRDTAVAKPKKENFYHGILLGLLSYRGDWLVTSNAETGEGYSDILIEIDEELLGIVIEVKYAEEDRLEEACRRALAQIEEMEYGKELIEDGMKKVVKYGIACYKKHCKVMIG